MDENIKFEAQATYTLSDYMKQMGTSLDEEYLSTLNREYDILTGLLKQIKTD